MSLKDDALIIKNEVSQGANTANRVGSMFENTLANVPVMGLFDYNHGSGTQSYTSGELVLINDGTGPFTNKLYIPEGVTEIWDTTNNKFDFTELSLGDTVDIRLDITITTTSPNQTIDINLRLGYGDVSAYDIPFAFANFKNSGTHPVNRFNGVYMGDALTLNNPAKFIFTSDASATISVAGWYVRIFKRSQVSV